MADPDFVYDPNDWEWTCNWDDRGLLVEDLPIGDVHQFATLVEGPLKWAAHVVVTRDENGDPDETEVRWFDTEAEARVACDMPPYVTAG